MKRMRMLESGECQSGSQLLVGGGRVEVFWLGMLRVGLAREIVWRLRGG